MDRLERARTAADSVEGWLTPAEGELLFSLAASCPAGGTIVEIGSWKGKSTTWLAEGAGQTSGIRIFAIDPHEPYLADPQADSLRDFRANLERLGLTALVTPIVARSEAAAVPFDQPIDLLFIDGDHEAGPVAADLACGCRKCGRAAGPRSTTSGTGNGLASAGSWAGCSGHQRPWPMSGLPIPLPC